MTDTEVFEVVKRALQKQFPSRNEAIMDTPLLHDGVMTSIMAVQLCADIGQQLGISISPAELAMAQTGRDIADIASKLASR